MPHGKIVAVNGANISISARAPEDVGPIIDWDGRTLKHLGITAAAVSKADIDYAILMIGQPVEFNACNGRIWFPRRNEVLQPSEETVPASATLTGQERTLRR